MSLTTWLRDRWIVSKETAYLKENPGMQAWLLSHKAALGDLFIISSAVSGILATSCTEPACLKVAMGLGVLGLVLKAAGVTPSDADARAKALQSDLAPHAAALEAAAPHLEAIVAAVIKAHQDAAAATPAPPAKPGA